MLTFVKTVISSKLVTTKYIVYLLIEYFFLIPIKLRMLKPRFALFKNNNELKKIKLTIDILLITTYLLYKK